MLLSYDVEISSHFLLNFEIKFFCVHRLSVAPGTPEGGQNFSASQGSSSSTTVTLDDVMQQLRLTDVVMQQLRHSTGVVDSKLGLIQDSLAGIKRTMAGIPVIFNSIPNNSHINLLLALFTNLNAFITKQFAVNEESSTIL